MLSRTDEQLSATVSHRSHRFDTVHHEVDNHLLQLHSISQHRQDIGGQLHPQHHAIFLYFTLYQTNNLLNDFVNIQTHLLGATFLDQGANPPDHIAGALPVPDNALYCLPRFLQVWSPACEPPQTGVGVGYDGGEWLIDLVSNGGR